MYTKHTASRNGNIRFAFFIFAQECNKKKSTVSIKDLFLVFSRMIN